MNDNYNSNPNYRNANNSNSNSNDDCHGSHCGKERKGCGNGDKSGECETSTDCNSTDCNSTNANNSSSNVRSGTPNQKGEQEYFPALEDENVEF